MSNSLGLAELLLVLLGAMAWGGYELWALRRSRKPPRQAPRKKDGLP